MLNKIMIFISLLLINGAIYAAEQPANQALDKILSSLNSMTANFSQTTYGNHGKILQKATGKMAVSRPNKFRWYTLKPNKQLIVTNGKLLWVYDVDLEQASVRYLKKIQQSNPAMLLSGGINKTEQYYQIQLQQQQGDDSQTFKLIPKQKEGLFKQLILSFKQKKLVQMNFNDNLGQRVIVKFSNIRINPKLATNQFTFKAPAGVDVIGLKKQ